MGDTLRYYQRDSDAAKALLIRRLRCLAAYETANRNLEKARSKNKDVHAVKPLTYYQQIFFIFQFLMLTLLGSKIILFNVLTDILSKKKNALIRMLIR